VKLAQLSIEGSALPPDVAELRGELPLDLRLLS
jgi:hypothetical protein